MPVSITTYPANAKPIAETEEFKELLKQVAQSQSLLNQISSQIVAIEAKMKPNTNKGAYLPLADPATQQAQQGQYQSGTGQPVTTAAGAPVMSRQAVQERTSFAKSISEMRRIAGLE